MIIIMKTTSSAEDVSAITERLRYLGYSTHLSQGEERSIVGILGNGAPLDKEQLSRMSGVEKVVAVSKPYKLASREYNPDDRQFQVRGVQIGGKQPIYIAGPSMVESRSQILEIAHAIKEAGASILRASTYKGRNSPYSFQGLGKKGLEYLAEAREATGLPIITGVSDPALVPMITEWVDILQVSSRNMQNYPLLNAIGASNHPVLLKRGMGATLTDLLMSAEYILSYGNDKIILCERGIRTYERTTLDIHAIPLLKKLSPLPVFADPSNGTASAETVDAVARASIAAGADGIMMDVHANPSHAMSAGGQSLTPERYADIVRQMRKVAEAIGR